MPDGRIIHVLLLVRPTCMCKWHNGSKKGILHYDLEMRRNNYKKFKYTRGFTKQLTSS